MRVSIDVIAMVNKTEPDVNNVLKVIFLPTYSVKLGEKVYHDASLPAVDICSDRSAAG